MRRRQAARLTFIVLLIVCSIGFLVQVSTGSVTTFQYLDKVVHFGAFFVLAWAFHRAFPTPIWLALIVLTGYGLLIEYVQDLLPYRQSSWGDLLADALGALAYYAIDYSVVGWRSWRRQKKRRQSE